MQKLTVTGINKNNAKSIVWSGLPSGAYLVIRNRTDDDSIVVTQTVALEADELGQINYNKISTPIKRGEEQSFLVEDNTLPFEISTETNYATDNSPNCVSAIVLNNDNLKQENANIYVVNLVNETALVNTTKIENKGVAYLQAVEFNVKLETILQDEFPTKRVGEDKRLIQKTNYTAYLGAGRGYLLKDIKGIVQGAGSNKDTENILKQVESYNHQQYNKDTNTIEIATVEVPYIPKFVKGDVLAFDTELRKVYDKGQTYIEYPKAMGEAMFQAQVSKANSIYVLNNKTNSNITKISTAKSPDDSTKEIFKEMTDEEGYAEGFYGDAEDILDTRMWMVSDNSQYQWWQDRFDPQKLKWIAFTVQTTSQDYPYSIAFTAPLFGGITFLSDTSLKLHLGNRECLYNGVEHWGKVLRIVMNYEADYLQLYVNGEKIEHESQSSSTFTNKETNTFGVDVKEGYTHEEVGFNMISQILGAKASLNITAETLDHNPDNDLIEPNDYTIDYNRISDTSAQVFLLPLQENIGNKNKGIVPLGSVTGNAQLKIQQPTFFMWETASKDISSVNFTDADKAEDALFAIATEDSAPSIVIKEQSVQGVISVSFLKDKAMDLYTGISKYATQSQGYRYKFAIKCDQKVSATAKVLISWTDSTGAQTKELDITVAEA